MSNVVETEVVHDHPIPVVVFQFGRYMSRNIEVYFGEVLYRNEKWYTQLWTLLMSLPGPVSTDRNEERTRAILPSEESFRGEEFQPCVVAVEDQLAAFLADLREPGVL